MPLEIGTRAPGFSLLNQNRQPVALADLMGRSR
jgi:peroxiredoxin